VKRFSGMFILIILVLTIYSDSLILMNRGKSYSLKTKRADDIIYVSTDQLAQISSSRSFIYETITEKMTILGKVFEFHIDNRFIRVNDEIYSMERRTKAEDDGLYIPLWGFLRILSSVLGERYVVLSD
jgi:hypothetical protein